MNPRPSPTPQDETRADGIAYGTYRLLFAGDDLAVDGEFLNEEDSPTWSVEDSDPDEVNLTLYEHDSDDESVFSLYLTAKDARALSSALDAAAARSKDESITTADRIERHR